MDAHHVVHLYIVARYAVVLQSLHHIHAIIMSLLIDGCAMIRHSLRVSVVYVERVTREVLAKPALIYICRANMDLCSGDVHQTVMTCLVLIPCDYKQI